MSHRSLNRVVVGALFLLAGCVGAAEEPGDFAEAPALEALGGPTKGSGGINGLSPIAYHSNVNALLGSLSVAAADPRDSSGVNPTIVASGLLDTEGGRDVFSYAARCALPAGTRLVSGSRTYAGGGILGTTGRWLTAGLTTEQKEDALTCLVTHLNTFSAHVPIFLSGPSIAGAESSEASDFNVEEAVWQVKLQDGGQAPVYYAWPRVNLLDTCGLLTTVTWITRICGSVLNTCGVQVRYDRATACSGSDGIFSCNGKPAIQTTLEESDLCSLHLGLSLL